jgi:hypothetical protein
MSVAAHLIVGKREEPFLEATLKSLDGVVAAVFVNENSGDPDGVNARVLDASRFAREGRLFIDPAPFVDFSDARNRVLALHRRHGGAQWAAFIDADEVHRPAAATIARNLESLPTEIAVVDGYTRHYLQSFTWYTTIERRMSFFRVTPELHWERPVHEKLEGVAGSTLVLPYVYDHYGMVLPMLHYADKGRRYSSLGQAGTTYTDAELVGEDPIHFFRDFWPLALRYDGDHPAAVLPVRVDIAHQNPGFSARVDSAIRDVQTPSVRASNLARRINFEYRWRARMLDPRARRLMNAH